MNIEYSGFISTIGQSMNETKSLDRRNLDRLKLVYYLRLYDRATQKPIGSVLDISTQGMKILSDTTFALETPYAFSILLPEGSIFGESIIIDAQCRWCKQKVTGEGCEAGFEFTKKVDSGIYVVKALIEDLLRNKKL